MSVTLDKISCWYCDQPATHRDGHGVGLVCQSHCADECVTQPRPTPRPWYPLVGHRVGLRMNDPATLHSAFVILAMAGGAQCMSIDAQAEVDHFWHSN